MTHYTLNISINLGGLIAETNRRVQHVRNLVALGLNAPVRVENGALEFPGVPVNSRFDLATWTEKEASEHWTNWILANGFREIAEITSGTLEQIQRVLSVWALRAHSGGNELPGEEYNERFVKRGIAFHGMTIGQKLDFLKNTYSFEMEPTTLEEAHSLTMARNCLVHRHGIVSPRDTTTDEGLMLRWRTFAAFVVADGKESELRPPMVVNRGDTVVARTTFRSKLFRLGERVEVSAEEFSEICWSMFHLANASSAQLQKYGEARGIVFDQPKEPLGIDFSMEPPV